MFYTSVCCSQLTWMRTLQGITGLALLTVIGGLFYRSVSLYHPRRKAILHIKNLRKSKKQQREFENKPPYCDISPLRMRSLQLFMLSCSLTAFGMYTPFCLLVSNLLNMPYHTVPEAKLTLFSKRHFQVWGVEGNYNYLLPIRSSDNDSTGFWPPGSLHTLGADGHI